ncbi:MAG: heme-binding domain-containing protein [Pyrinomonadaceae bacterium]
MSVAGKTLKIVIIVLVVLFIGIQFIRPSLTNPQIDSTKTIEANVTVSPEVAQILETSCNDCHSNAVKYPWYSNVAPVSWLVAHDVNEARTHLNFSEWGNYAPQKQEGKLDETCEVVESGEMPDFKYLLIHWNAKLSDAQKKTICDWTKAAGVEIAKKAGANVPTEGQTSDHDAHETDED